MIDKRKRNILLLFIVPALIFYLIFWISPVLMSFYYGLTNWRGMGDFDMWNEELRESDSAGNPV